MRAGTLCGQLEEDVRREPADGPPHQVRRCAHRQPDPAGTVVGKLHGDIGRRVTRPDDEDVSAAVRPRVDELPGVNDLAFKAFKPRPARGGRRAIVSCGENYCPAADFA